MIRRCFVSPPPDFLFFFFFNDTATTEIYTLSLHDALPNCRFQPGAAESLAFPDSAFDVVASSLIVHHLPEEGRLEAVCEMPRVLCPGGTLLLADFRMPERDAWRLLGSLHGAAAMQRRVPP